MNCPPPSHWLFSLALLINRLALGLYFLLAGVAKVQGGVSNFVDGPFKSMSPKWLPDWFARPYGYALPTVEIVVGALLTVGLAGRAASGIISMMLISFLIVAGIADQHGPFNSNLILLSLALLLTLTGTGRFSLDSLICKSCRGKSCKN